MWRDQIKNPLIVTLKLALKLDESMYVWLPVFVKFSANLNEFLIDGSRDILQLGECVVFRKRATRVCEEEIPGSYPKSAGGWHVW